MPESDMGGRTMTRMPVALGGDRAIVTVCPASLSPGRNQTRDSSQQGGSMTPRFTRRFRVRHYELDALGRVHGVSFLRYMQEAAIEASTALGFSPDWYSERGVGWVVRKLAVRYHAPAAYGDEVEVATWLSGIRGVRSIREYDLTRVRD